MIRTAFIVIGMVLLGPTVVLANPTWVGGYPILTTLPPSPAAYADMRVTVVGLGGNQVQIKCQKGNQVAFAPTGLESSTGQYRGYFYGGPGTWTLTPVIVNAQGQVVSSGTAVNVTFP